MKEPPIRRAAGQAASILRTNMSRIGRIVLAVLVMALGGSLAGVMAFATFYEFLANDFFGVCVAGMVVIFGLQLVRIGYEMAMGSRKMTNDPDPVDELWHSETRVHPFRPYSELEIRGR